MSVLIDLDIRSAADCSPEDSLDEPHFVIQAEAMLSCLPCDNIDFVCKANPFLYIPRSNCINHMLDNLHRSHSTNGITKTWYKMMTKLKARH